MSFSRPSAPSPAVTLVPMDEAWPSPGLSRIVTEPLFNSPVSPAVRVTASRRVQLLTTIGELMDDNLLSEAEVGSLFELAFRGDKEAGHLADLLEARPSLTGKAQFLRIFLSISGMYPSGFTTPAPTSYMHPTPFVDLPSPMVRSASPPMRFPMAVRPAGCQKLVCIQEDLVRGQSTEEEDPKLSPESYKSTNVGSSVDVSTVSPPGREGQTGVVV